MVNEWMNETTVDTGTAREPSMYAIVGKTGFQKEGSDLIQFLTEDRLRHASGPVHYFTHPLHLCDVIYECSQWIWDHQKSKLPIQIFENVFADIIKMIFKNLELTFKKTENNSLNYNLSVKRVNIFSNSNLFWCYITDISFFS